MKINQLASGTKKLFWGREKITSNSYFFARHMSRKNHNRHNLQPFQENTTIRWRKNEHVTRTPASTGAVSKIELNPQQDELEVRVRRSEKTKKLR